MILTNSLLGFKIKKKKFFYVIFCVAGKLIWFAWKRLGSIHNKVTTFYVDCQPTMILIFRALD